MKALPLWTRLLAASVLLAGIVIVGCSKATPQGAVVVGKLKYKGGPIKGGEVKLHTGGQEFPSALTTEGGFTFNGVPEGEAILTVNTEGVKTMEAGPPGGAKKKMPKEVDTSKLPTGSGGMVYTQIPKKYNKKESSDLKITVGKGKTEVGELELRD